MSNAILTLMSLRFDIDQLVYLHEYGSYYWLKKCLNQQGVRIGITSCCEIDYECEHHKSIRQKIELQNLKMN